jgi:two-component system OmpR family response regulator
MDRPEHILVVDDDPQILEVVNEYLSEEGFRVSLASDGQAMQKLLRQEPVDLVILDVRLPGEDGLTLAAQLRRYTQAGIIMLSRKGELIDRVAGLEVGADDYVAKPFHLRELLARVRSVLRRNNPARSEARDGSDEKAPGKLLFAGYELDRRRRLLLSPSGQPVELSTGELDLLLAFLDHPKRPLTRDQLLNIAHGREATLFDRSIDVQVGRLRRKIEANPRRPELIKTVRGVGYMLTSDVKRQ